MLELLSLLEVMVVVQPNKVDFDVRKLRKRKKVSRDRMTLSEHGECCIRRCRSSSDVCSMRLFAATRHLNWSFWEGIFRGSGGLFHTLNQPISPTKRPNAKRKSKTKAFFGLPGADLITSEHLPHHHLGRPNPPPLARLAPTRRFWVHQRRTLPLHTPDIRF